MGALDKRVGAGVWTDAPSYQGWITYASRSEVYGVSLYQASNQPTSVSLDRVVVPYLQWGHADWSLNMWLAGQ